MFMTNEFHMIIFGMRTSISTHMEKKKQIKQAIPVRNRQDKNRLKRPFFHNIVVATL